jgi:rhodanese-related sulfurtransferase
VRTDGLTHLSYLIGDRSSGHAAVIDPRRDVEVYLDLARQHHLTITHAVETHIHADFVSGSRALAACTGTAKVAVSAEGDAHYGFTHEPPGCSTRRCPSPWCCRATGTWPRSCASSSGWASPGSPAASKGGMEAWATAGLPMQTLAQLPVQELNTLPPPRDFDLLDVRTPREWDEGHLPGARYLFLGDLPEKLRNLDPGRPVVVYCASGYRSSLAASLLQATGFRQVWNVPAATPPGRPPSSRSSSRPTPTEKCPTRIADPPRKSWLGVTISWCLWQMAFHGGERPAGKGCRRRTPFPPLTR